MVAKPQVFERISSASYLHSSELDGEQSNVIVYFPHTQYGQVQVCRKPEAWNSIAISHIGGQDPGSCAITYFSLWSTLAEQVPVAITVTRNQVYAYGT